MDSKEKLSLSEQIRQEAGLPENFEAIDAPPIIPGAGGAQNSGDRFLQGTLPPYTQLPTDFAKTASKSLTAPNLSLMPLGPNASANNNAATESIIEQASEVATAAATAAANSVQGDMIWNGPWISFAVYDTDDVILYDNSAWIALQPSTNQQPDISPVQWQLLAKYSGGVNAQTGTTYTFLPSDNAQLVTFSNAAAIAVSLPVASTAGFNSGWYVDVQNIGVVGHGWVTITPTTSTIDGLASVTVQCGSGLRIFSDGTNYFTSRGAANLTLDNLSDFWPGREAQFFRPAEFTTGVCIDNACFEASTTMVSGAPPGWYNTYLSSGFQPLTFNTATPYIGDRSLQINGISGISGGGCAQNRVLTVMPGETYQISGWIQTDGTCTGNIDLVFTNYPITTASVITASSAASSWTYVVASGTVPTGAGSSGYCLGILQLVTVSGSSGSVCSFDDIRIHRIFGASGASSSPGMVPDPGSSAGSTRYLREDGSWQVPPGGSGGGGTVTSVAMTVPSWLTVAGSPITGGGTLAVSATGGLTKNQVLATPDGTNGALSVRALVAGDIPNIDASSITSGELALARGGTGSDLSGTGGTSQVLQQSSTGADVTVAQLAFSDISGSVAASQLPNPTATTLGGVKSVAPAIHEWINAISTSGVPSQTQPDFSDLSGDATTAQILTAAGGLTLADLASPYLANNVPLSSVTTGAATAPLIGILSDNSVSMYGYGGDQAISAVDGAVYAFDGSGNRAGAFSETNLLADITSGTALSVDTLFANTVDAISGFEVNGSPLNFTNIAGSVAASQLPNPTATTLGGIESIAATSHKWIDSISTSGVPHQSQPAFTDISGAASTGQIPNLPASIITSGQLALARGGTDADLSATGGTSKVLRQSSTGAAITVSQLGYSDLSGNPENLNVGTSGASAVPLTVTAAASQTADVLDLDDSSGTPQIAASFDASATFPFTGDPTRGFVFAKPANGARKAFIGIGDEAVSTSTWINMSFDTASALSSGIACGEGLAIYPVLSSADLFHECFPPSGGWALFGANGGEGLALFAQNGGPVRIYSGGLASGNLCAEFPTSGGLKVTGSFVLNGSGGTSQVLKQTSSGGAITVAQLAFTDISGTVAAAQLPNPTASTLGGVESIASTSHEWIDSISTSGVPHQSQPAFNDISGSVAAAQLPNPTASTLGGVESIAAVSHKWVDSISTAGAPHQSQPAFGDISGTATVAQMPASVLDFSIACFAPGVGIASQTLTRVALAQSVTFPSGASGSYAISDVLATGSTTYTLSKNGVPFATVVFTSASLTGTWTQASDVTFSAGDILKIAGPSSPDSTLADVGITLAGQKN